MMRRVASRNGLAEVGLGGLQLEMPCASVAGDGSALGLRPRRRVVFPPAPPGHRPS